MATQPGRLIVFEGPDGVGKTTQVDRMRKWYKQDYPNRPTPVFCREPGGTRLGEQLRKLLLVSRKNRTKAAEAMLFLAARAQLQEEVIKPAIEQGRDVILDRYDLSTMVYQLDGCFTPAGAMISLPPFAFGWHNPDFYLLLLPPADKSTYRQAPGRKAQKATDAFEKVSRNEVQSRVVVYRTLAYMARNNQSTVPVADRSVIGLAGTVQFKNFATWFIHEPGKGENPTADDVEAWVRQKLKMALIQ